MPGSVERYSGPRSNHRPSAAGAARSAGRRYQNPGAVAAAESPRYSDRAVEFANLIDYFGERGGYIVMLMAQVGVLLA